MKCPICGEDAHCLISYEGLKTKIKTCCIKCYHKMKGVVKS